MKKIAAIAMFVLVASTLMGCKKEIISSDSETTTLSDEFTENPDTDMDISGPVTEMPDGTFVDNDDNPYSWRIPVEEQAELFETDPDAIKANKEYENADFVEFEYNSCPGMGFCAFKDGGAFLEDIGLAEAGEEASFYEIEKYLLKNTDAYGWQLSYIEDSFKTDGIFPNFYLSVDNIPGYAIRVYYSVQEHLWSVHECDSYYHNLYPNDGYTSND